MLSPSPSFAGLNGKLREAFSAACGWRLSSILSPVEGASESNSGRKPWVSGASTPQAQEARQRRPAAAHPKHGSLTDDGLAPTQDTSVISRLVLRRDGFFSARAAYAGGEFTTPPLRIAGRQLVLNVDTSATSLLRCELQDKDGKPIEGHRLNDCDVIHTANDIDRRVTWKGKDDVSALAAKPVRLRVVFRDTDLYAFQFRN